MGSLLLQSRSAVLVFASRNQGYQYWNRIAEPTTQNQAMWDVRGLT